MFLSDLVDAIYLAGYGFDTAQRARQAVMAELPGTAEEVMGQPLMTAQANPAIPDELGFAIMKDLSIPVDFVDAPE
jgi:hypothetical protein